MRFGYTLELISNSDLSNFPGRHPCAGMKIAKLELKIVLALMLLGYNNDLVNESGKYPDILPEIDRNDFIKVKSWLFDFDL